MSFSATAELISGGGQATSDELVVCLMEYLKNVAQEKRENKELRNLCMASTLTAKSAQLDKQSRAIDEGMREAGEKADIAMAAATTGMGIGVAQGLVQIGAAVASYQGSAKADLTAGMMNATGTMLGALNTYVQGSAQAEQFRVDERGASGNAKKQANELQKVVNEVEQKLAKADDHVKQSQEHYTAIKEAIKKTLDQRASLSRQARRSVEARLGRWLSVAGCRG